jgi:hypothetical protein
MKRIKINLIEDTEGYDFALKYEIGPILNKLGFETSIQQRLDGSMIEQDLVIGIDILIVDYDLGNDTGDAIIDTVNSFLEYSKLPIIFYSGGQPVDFLKSMTKKYGNVRCSTKNQVGDILIDLIRNKFLT